MMESSDEEMPPLSPGTGLLIPDLSKNDALPPESKKKYLKAYKLFMKWRIEKQLDSFDESVFLMYFKELAKKLQPSSLWSIYSMLNSTMKLKHDMTIKNFQSIALLLKQLSAGFKSKQSMAFTSANVEKFLNEAPDSKYLATKVVLIFGISGACKASELVNISVDDVEVYDNLIFVKLYDMKTKAERTFVVRGENIPRIQKYQALRPRKVKTKRFFLNYQYGKCTVQVIGRHKISAMPKTIATYLMLPDPERYTGYCFRRTSLSLKFDTLTTLQRPAKYKTIAKNVQSLPLNEQKPCTSQENLPAAADTQPLVDGEPYISWDYNICISPQPTASSPNEEKPCIAWDYASEDKQQLVRPQVSSSQDPHNETRRVKGQEATITQLNQQTIINIPGKAVNLTIENCSNFTVNFQ